MADALGIYNYYDPNRAGWKAEKYSPEIAGLLDADDDPGAVIRALAAEAREIAQAQEPTLADALTTNAATHRRKLPGRAAVDAQRQHFLDRALEIYGRPEDGRNPSAWARLPEEMQAAMQQYATNEGGFRDNIANPYEYTGWLGPGSRLHTASTWMMGLPTAAYQVSHMLANAAGNVIDGQGGGVKTTADAVDDFARAGGTLAAPVTSLLGWDDRAPTAWSQAARVRQALDEEPRGWLQDDLVLDNRGAQAFGAAVEAKAGAMESGEELLNAYNVDQAIGKLPTRVIGTIMDDTLNPMWEGDKIAKAARAGKTASAARGLALEHLPGVGLAGYQTYLEEKLRRLEEARR